MAANGKQVVLEHLPNMLILKAGKSVNLFLLCTSAKTRLCWWNTEEDKVRGVGKGNDADTPLNVSRGLPVTTTPSAPLQKTDSNHNLLCSPC